MSKSAPNHARELAATVLTRVWREQAYASPTLDAELKRKPINDVRDVRLATEFVYGVLRTLPVLEERLMAFANKDGWKKNDYLRAQLLIAAYSILFLDRIPVFAAVSVAVESVKRHSGQRVSGFVNAVLRKLVRSLPDGEKLEILDCAANSTPAWLRRALEKALGAEEATAFLNAGPIPPPASLCLDSHENRSAWVERLRQAAPAADVSLGAVSSRAVSIRHGGDLRRLPGAQTNWLIQEEGAQAIALLVGARAGETVLDACAGRGNKSYILAQAVSPNGAADAADLYPNKLKRIKTCPHRGKLIRDVFAVDWTRGTGEVPKNYDRVLVDAPCTGVGTLRRRPEITHRLKAEDPARLSALQTKIVRAAASRVRDQGRLIFAVCSVLREEAEDVITALQQAPVDGPHLEPVPFDSELGHTLAPKQSTVRLLPHHHGSDGYFVASFLVHHPPSG